MRGYLALLWLISTLAYDRLNSTWPIRISFVLGSLLMLGFVSCLTFGHIPWNVVLFVPFYSS